MSVIQIREAQRAGARLVIGLAGVSGSGKTYTALQLAYGLANGDASKVGLLDTENKRGSLYSDILKNRQKQVQRFKIGDLYSPFSPQRYVDAILAFQDAGVEVLVIDSVSHEWNGLGGVLDMVDSAGKSIHGWKKATPAHRKFMNTMLQCDMHIICCIRAQNKTDWKDPKNPKNLGLLPVQREDFMFEMTASMMMWNGGKSRDVLKCPEELEGIFGKAGESVDGFLTPRSGLDLRKWVDGGVQLDAGVEHARNSLRTVTEQGVQAIRKAWDAQPEGIRKALGAGYMQELLEAAEAYEDQRASAVSTDAAAVDDLNSEVLGNGASTEPPEGRDNEGQGA